MNKALWKDTFREMKKSFGRFLSIFAIVALGVAFLAGVQVTSPRMKRTVDRYMDQYQMMDLRILSTLGFEEEEVQGLRQLPMLEGVYPAYSQDLLGSIAEGTVAIRVQSLPFLSTTEGDRDYINQLEVVEGRLPQASDEVVVDAGDFASLKIAVGDTLFFRSGTDTSISDSIIQDTYKVVGRVRGPYYLHSSRGSTTIGNGRIDSFCYIAEENFVLPAYTEVFATVVGARELDSFATSYTELLEAAKESIAPVVEELSTDRFERLRQEAESKLSEGEATYLAEEMKVKEKLALAEQELVAGKAAVQRGEQELAEKGISAEDGFKQGEKTLDAAQKALEESQVGLSKEEEQLGILEKEISAIRERIATITDPEERQHQEEILAEKETLYFLTQAALEEAKLYLEEQLASIAAHRIVLQTARGTAKRQLQEAKAALEKSKATLKEGEISYAEGKEEATTSLREARKELNAAKEQVAALKSPTTYVLGREAHMGFVQFQQAAGTIEAIAKVFPLFFFLVAALVCLTTMTRMIDEQRGTIGTYKALGYGDGAIIAKYALYALLASLIGSVVGVVIGYEVFPTIIYGAYGMIFDVPPLHKGLDIGYAVSSIGVMVLLTIGAATFACTKELRTLPAYLQRPKAPKAGKKILLERMPVLWNRLNFLHKVVARNIFRYKKKFFMTTIGVAGCTALLLAGIGLKESVFAVVELQYGAIFDYDLEVTIKEEKLPLPEVAEVAVDTLVAYRSNLQAVGVKMEQDVTVLVPNNLEQMAQYVHLTDVKTREPVRLPKEGAVITDKLARLLGAKKGDTIYLKNSQLALFPVTIEEIVTHYIGHYIYLSPAYYEQVFGAPMMINQLFVKLPPLDSLQRDRLASLLLETEEIVTYAFTADSTEGFSDMMGSLNTVIGVMVICAGLLAIIVLYNLTTINISERMRELATIKVLGFYDLEVSRYIYRENTVLTAVGALVGLVLGVFLHGFILVTAEMDNVVYDRRLYGVSYVLAFLLTFVFAGVVNLLMHFQLKKIKMVESLKSVD